MKKFLLVIGIILVYNLANAQVFSTGQTLKQGAISLGINPVIQDGGPSDGLNVFFHGGYGLKQGVDLGIKLGIGNSPYYGADIEWALGKLFSLTTGGHLQSNLLVFDGTFLGTIPIKSDARIFYGADLDVIIDNDIDFPLWFPVGLELGLSKTMSLILEGDIAVTGPAYHIFGGGLNFYF